MASPSPFRSSFPALCREPMNSEVKGSHGAATPLPDTPAIMGSRHKAGNDERWER
jgi:hypothetical protein